MFSLVRALALAATTLAPEYAHLGATPPPQGLPEIRSYKLSATTLHAGQTANGTVETTDNVVLVEGHINYHSVPLTRTSPGHFALTYTVPWWLPPWLRKAYTLEIVARTADGVETMVYVPISIR